MLAELLRGQMRKITRLGEAGSVHIGNHRVTSQPA